jgi:hypothetical protein
MRQRATPENDLHALGSEGFGVPPRSVIGSVASTQESPSCSSSSSTLVPIVQQPATRPRTRLQDNIVKPQSVKGWHGLL